MGFMESAGIDHWHDTAPVCDAHPQLPSLACKFRFWALMNSITLFKWWQFEVEWQLRKRTRKKMPLFKSTKLDTSPLVECSKAMKLTVCEARPVSERAWLSDIDRAFLFCALIIYRSFPFPFGHSVLSLTALVHYFSLSAVFRYLRDKSSRDGAWSTRVQ